MEEIERLAAYDAIRQLKSRYFRCLDTKNWVELREVFCSDAIFDARGAMGNARIKGATAKSSDDWLTEGRDAIVEFISSRSATSATVHHGHGHEVEIVDADRARGVIAMEDQNRYFDATGNWIGEMHGCGHYHEEYRKEDGRWRIWRSVLSRLRVDFEMFETPR